MSYWNFVSTYRTLLAFGLVTALSSSFGQTFFISLFLPYFLADFELTKGDFGFLYGLATLGSALCLPYLGARIDSLELKRYTTLTLGGMAAAAFLVASAPHVALLVVGIVGLRLTGQGLMGHISQTVMAREFTSSRGKALGFAGLGYPLGEAVLPLVCAVALQFLPWEAVWMAVGVGALALVLPLALRLLDRKPSSTEATVELPAGSVAGRRPFARDWRLYCALPALLTPPFVMTVLFLYQAPLTEFKGWRPEWMAAAFTGFAITRAFTSLAVGPIIDRFSARALLPVFTLPLGFAALLVSAADTPWALFPYLMLIGMTAGSNASVGSALWVELYGTENLGRIRSMASACAVFSAASGPAVMGGLFSLGYGFTEMLAGAAGLAVATSSIALVLAVKEGAVGGGRLARAWR